jgi:hypothetical protein
MAKIVIFPEFISMYALIQGKCMIKNHLGLSHREAIRQIIGGRSSC